jgi:hypothetical protein
MPVLRLCDGVLKEIFSGVLDKALGLDGGKDVSQQVLRSQRVPCLGSPFAIV